MSVALIRPFFDTRLKGLSYKKWDDGFNFENIPSTVLDKSYHVSLLDESTGLVNIVYLDHTIGFPVTVRVFFKGYSDPEDAIDEAALAMQTICEDILSPENRLTLGGGIIDISLDSGLIEPIDLSNDNSVLLTISFIARVVLDTANC